MLKLMDKKKLTFLCSKFFFINHTVCIKCCCKTTFCIRPVLPCRSFEQLLAYEEDDLEEIFCLHFEVCSFTVLVDLSIMPPLPT